MTLTPMQMRHGDTMADVNVNVNAPAEQAPAMAPPTRTDDQILPRSRWVPVGKRNCYLDVVKSQSNPIYKIAVDILKHTNFFRAFMASSTIPSIYIQQFWDTIRYDKTTGSYSCQLDEQWFDLNKDTLRDALQITPVNNNQSFSSPLTPDVLIKFINNPGYPKVVRTLSDVVTNDMFQPWRALTTNQFMSYGKDFRKEASHSIVIPKYVLGISKFSAIGTPNGKFLGCPFKSIISANIQGKETKAGYGETLSTSPAKQSKWTRWQRSKNQRSPLQLDDECVDEGVPENDPRLDDEEVNLQKAVEEGLIPVDNDKGHAGTKHGIQDEGTAGSNPRMLLSLNLNTSHVFHVGTKP
ncbi:hypothetical protein Tco_0813153 [Tanacetum coccineum]